MKAQFVNSIVSSSITCGGSDRVVSVLDNCIHVLCTYEAFVPYFDESEENMKTDYKKKSTHFIYAFSLSSLY